MNTPITTDAGYKAWISDLKTRIRQSQLKAAVKVNTEMLRLYWSVGGDIVEKKAEAQWGKGLIDQLSRDLMKNFPGIQGFSPRNLRSIKQWYLFYSQTATIWPQPAAELNATPESEKWLQLAAKIDPAIFSIPWGHHLIILNKIKDVHEALFYIHKTLENGWSRNVLLNMLDTGLYQAQGKALTNFSRLLPAPQSELAQQTLKDPYNFDFLTMREGYVERELEDALTENITKFLLELGSGFAYVGRQVRITVGDREFFIDLLFYNLKLRCYVVVELKTKEFEPEYISKLGFYVTAVNNQLRHPSDNDTIGLLICKTKDEIVARYSLQTSTEPIGISEYELTRLMPDDFKSSLPTIEEIQNAINHRQ